MKQRFFTAALLLLMMFVLSAQAETIGVLADRGLSLPMTREDADLGLRFYADRQTVEDAQILSAVLCYCSPRTPELEKQLQADCNVYAADSANDPTPQRTEHTYHFYRVYLPENEEQLAALQRMAPLTDLGEHNGRRYVMESLSPTAAGDDDPQALEAAAQRARELMAQLIFPEEKAAENLFPAFSTVDLNGAAVDNSLFSRANLTVINIWSTTCYPCIEEMPLLAQWAQKMPEEAQLIGIVLDVSVPSGPAADAARMICSATGADYPNLILSEDLRAILSGLQFTPTTLFVNDRGELVGEPVIGANVSAYQRFAEDYLSE